MTSLDIYQSSNTPKFAEKLLTLGPLHIILAWTCKKTNPFLSKSKNTPMTCKPRENTGLWENYATRCSLSFLKCFGAHRTRFTTMESNTLLPQGSTTGVQYKYIYISTHYSTSKRTCIQVIQDCSRVNRIVFMHIFSHVALQICRSQQYLTRQIRSFGGGCVHNTTPSCRDQFAAECKPELGEISTSISLMRPDFKFSSKKTQIKLLEVRTPIAKAIWGKMK